MYAVRPHQFARPLVMINDPQLVRYILQAGFSAGKYGRGPFFSEQYFVRGPVWLLADWGVEC